MFLVKPQTFGLQKGKLISEDNGAPYQKYGKYKLKSYHTFPHSLLTCSNLEVSFQYADWFKP